MIYRHLNFIILFLILVCLVIILLKGTFEPNKINLFPFLFGIIAIVFQIACIILEFIIREYEKNIQGKYLKYIYHQVSEDYSKNKAFMKINYSLLFFYFINFLFLIITICNYEINPDTYHGLKNIVTDESNESRDIIEEEDQFKWCSSEYCCFCDIQKIINLQKDIKKNKWGI